MGILSVWSEGVLSRADFWARATPLADGGFAVLQFSHLRTDRVVVLDPAARLVSTHSLDQPVTAGGIEQLTDGSIAVG